MLLTEEEREEYTKKFVWLVKIIVHKHFGSMSGSNEYEDLLQEGWMALYRCTGTYDLDRNIKFETYAYRHVSGYIKKYFRDFSLIKVPRPAKECSYKIKQVMESKNITLNEVTLDDLEDIKYPEKTKLEALKLLSLGDLKVPIIDSDECEDIHGLTDLADTSYDPEKIYINNFIISSIPEFLSTNYSGRTRDIIEDYYYTILFGDNINQQDLADKYHVSQMTISRKISKFREDLIKFLQ